MSRLAGSFFKGLEDKKEEVEDEKAYKRDVFEWMTVLTISKEQHYSEESLKSFEPFITTKFLSMNPMFIDNMVELSLTKNLSKLDNYRYLLHSLPQRKIHTTYLAKKRKNIDIVKEQIISRHFGIGSRDTIMMMEHLPREEMKTILESYAEWTPFKKKR